MAATPMAPNTTTSTRSSGCQVGVRLSSTYPVVAAAPTVTAKTTRPAHVWRRAQAIPPPTARVAPTSGASATV